VNARKSQKKLIRSKKQINFAYHTVNAFTLPVFSGLLGLVNPFSRPDHDIAFWFHEHLTRTSAALLEGLSEPGSGLWIGIVLSLTVLVFLWKRRWIWLATLVVAVPGGMLLNEWVKFLVHRQRPFVQGPFVDWSGYSFASGHTIGATLLYGQFLLLLLPAIKSRRWRAAVISLAALLIISVGFSRVALGAHYLTDVLAAIIFGALWLAACALLARPLHRRHSARARLAEEVLGTPTAVPISGPAPVLVPVSADEGSLPTLVN